MAEPGVFRKRLFGGFNKKDVFKYYDELSREFTAAREDVESANEQLKKQLEDSNVRIAELEQALIDFKSSYEQLDARVEHTQLAADERIKQSEAEQERLRAENGELRAALAHYEGDDSYKARYEAAAAKLAKAQSDSSAQRTALARERAHSAELESLVAQMSDIVNRTDGIKSRVDAALRRRKRQGLD